MVSPFQNGESLAAAVLMTTVIFQIAIAVRNVKRLEARAGRPEFRPGMDRLGWDQLDDRQVRDLLEDWSSGFPVIEPA